MDTLKLWWSKLVDLFYDKKSAETDGVKLFGILAMTRNYWLWIMWTVGCVISYLMMDASPDNIHISQIHIHIRNLTLYCLALYTIRKFELIKIPFQEKLTAALDAGPESKSYGLALIATAIYYCGIIGGAATVIITDI